MTPRPLTLKQQTQGARPPLLWDFFWDFHLKTSRKPIPRSRIVFPQGSEPCCHLPRRHTPCTNTARLRGRDSAREGTIFPPFHRSEQRICPSPLLTPVPPAGGVLLPPSLPSQLSGSRRMGSAAGWIPNFFGLVGKGGMKGPSRAAGDATVHLQG